MSWTITRISVPPLGWYAVLDGQDEAVVAWARLQRPPGLRLVAGLVADGPELLPAPSIRAHQGYRPAPGAELQRRAPELPPPDLAEALDLSDVEGDEGARHEALTAALRRAATGEWAGAALRELEARQARQNAAERAIVASTRWRLLAAVAAMEQAQASAEAYGHLVDLAAAAPGAATVAEALARIGMTPEDWAAALSAPWPSSTTRRT